MIQHAAFADFGGYENDVTPEKVHLYEDMADRSLRYVTFSNNWFQGIYFPYAKAVRMNRRGILPLIRMMPRSDFNTGKRDPKFSLESIVWGEHDKALKEWGEDCNTFGERVLVDFACEMNGTWFPWSFEPPKLYIDAYRRIYGIIKKEAPRAEFVWHVNYDKSFENIKRYFPGNEFIDYVGTSIYGNYYPRSKPDPYRILAERMYGHLDVLSSKAPIVSETGVTEGATPEDKPRWISDFFDYVVKNRSFAMVSWWHSAFRIHGQKEDTNYRIDSTPEALAAYKAGVRKPEIT